MISAILFVGIGAACAQPANNEIKPSVNAQQFLSAASGDNSMQTGQLSVNIPLFDLAGKGINIPITISFNAGNINHQSEASSIGLGWSLLAGGVVSKSVRDQKDEDTPSPNNVPWQYDELYIQNKVAESANNPYAGLMVQTLDYMMAFDKEPDAWNYSFPGYSGDIYKKRNSDGSYSRKLAPDVSFKMEDTALGYKITDNKGIEYYFEAPEQDFHYNMISSWFLTRIRTPQGGEVLYQYADENAFNSADDDGAGHYGLIKSKRLTRIDYDYGYVTFGSAQREDMYYDGSSSDARRITAIKLYDKGGSLIKGYELGNNGYITTAGYIPSNAASWGAKRMKMSTLREYGPNVAYKPPYEFEYDNYFFNDKTLHYAFPAVNTWAINPSSLISTNRNRFGEMAPQLVWYWNPDEQEYEYYTVGYTVTGDPVGASVSDYFCMTRMKIPMGGEELYSYEKHTYNYLGTYDAPLDPGLVLQPQYIEGRRLRRKETRDNNGNTLIREYKYSDGILINPSIHTSTMYTSVYGNNQPLLQASPYTTNSPQNGRTGTPVYYAKVEEDFVSATTASNGKKIYYFDKMSSEPATSYVYVNTTNNGENILLNLPNVLYGKQFYPPALPQPLSILSESYGTYLAYPVGRFCETELSKGVLLKEITYDAAGQMVSKTENEYSGGYAADSELYGYIVQKFDDTGYNSPGYPSNHTYRYLICRMKNKYGGFKQLAKTTTTHYFQADSTAEEQTFTYTSQRLLRSSTTTQSAGITIIKENVYPDDIQFQTQSGLSVQAASVKRMNETNMTSYPLQSTVKKGTQYIAGSYITYKQLASGAVVADTVFSLENRPGISVNQPLVNASGKMEKGSNFVPEVSTLSYDANMNPATVVNRGGAVETTIWGYGGQYPIAKIANYTYDQVQGNVALLAQLALLDDYTTVATDVARANISACNQAIRNSLPQNAIVTTYTYAPLVGMTSATDPKGIATYYEYDSNNRLMNIRDKDGKILKHTDYHYQGQ